MQKQLKPRDRCQPAELTEQVADCEISKTIVVQLQREVRDLLATGDVSAEVDELLIVELLIVAKCSPKSAAWLSWSAMFPNWKSSVWSQL